MFVLLVLLLCVEWTTAIPAEAMSKTYEQIGTGPGRCRNKDDTFSHVFPASDHYTYATTLAACQAACDGNSECAAVDFNPEYVASCYGYKDEGKGFKADKTVSPGSQPRHGIKSANFMKDKLNPSKFTCWKKTEAYAKIVAGTCEDWTMQPILDGDECDKAALKLKLKDKKSSDSNDARYPQGCYYKEKDPKYLGVNKNKNDLEKPATLDRRLICKDAAVPSCKDVSQECHGYLKYCKNKQYEKYMRENCAKSCNFCRDRAIDRPVLKLLVDTRVASKKDTDALQQLYSASNMDKNVFEILLDKVQVLGYMLVGPVGASGSSVIPALTEVELTGLEKCLQKRNDCIKIKKWLKGKNWKKRQECAVEYGNCLLGRGQDGLILKAPSSGFRELLSGTDCNSIGMRHVKSAVKCEQAHKSAKIVNKMCTRTLKNKSAHIYCE